MSHCERNAGNTLLWVAPPGVIGIWPNAHQFSEGDVRETCANRRAGTRLISCIEKAFGGAVGVPVKPPEYYLAQAHAMVRQAKRTVNIDAQRAYLKLAKRWEQLAREASAQRGNPPPTEKHKPH